MKKPKLTEKDYIKALSSLGYDLANYEFNESYSFLTFVLRLKKGFEIHQPEEPPKEACSNMTKIEESEYIKDGKKYKRIVMQNNSKIDKGSH